VHLCRVPTVGSRQRLTAVSSGTAADGPLPRAPFAECVALGKLVFAECLPVPSVQHSVKGLFAESLTLPRAALGKAFFAECPTKSTWQRIQHSAKPRIPVVHRPKLLISRSSKPTKSMYASLADSRVETRVWKIFSFSLQIFIKLSLLHTI
jgi:hypothetical protein